MKIKENTNYVDDLKNYFCYLYVINCVGALLHNSTYYLNVIYHHIRYITYVIKIQILLQTGALI